MYWIIVERDFFGIFYIWIISIYCVLSFMFVSEIGYNLGFIFKFFKFTGCWGEGRVFFNFFVFECVVIFWVTGYVSSGWGWFFFGLA